MAEEDDDKQAGGGQGSSDDNPDGKDPDDQGTEGSKDDKSGDKNSGDKESGDKDSDDQKSDDEGSDKDEEKPKAIWPWVVAGLVLVVFVAAILILVLVPHEHVKTEDAYVSSHYTMVAPRVSGQVASVAVRDNQPVRPGQLLATIDPRDLQAALQQAEADREAARARVIQADAQIARQPAFIEQAAAQVVSARARLDLARADQQRFAALADTGAGTFQAHQQADATLRQSQAALIQAEAELLSQRRQLDSLRADRIAAVAQVARSDAAVAAAGLNLSYTRLYAPIGGVVAQKSVQVGNQVAPGVPIMQLVPLEGAFVIANYRELELRHMRAGQHAVIHVDAYDIDLDGIVESIAPASGATFSPIPPNNATGNFTKIVQRLPVKIVVAPHQPLARLLRAGLSVVVVVDTNLNDVVDATCRDRHWVDRNGDGRADTIVENDRVHMDDERCVARRDPR